MMPASTEAAFAPRLNAARARRSRRTSTASASHADGTGARAAPADEERRDRRRVVRVLVAVVGRPFPVTVEGPLAGGGAASGEAVGLVAEQRPTTAVPGGRLQPHAHRHRAGGRDVRGR